MIGGINGLGQVATVAGWEHGDAWITELVEGLDHNRHLLSELLSNIFPGSVSTSRSYVSGVAGLP
ncbi:MAG: hypothetical protein Ct9H300mP26_1830 [Acidimicrobiales bacterium]|nr:MAG: hypothetical protein Ct9H300mP26_1830 [Acidimicrobiales bacterium]